MAGTRTLTCTPNAPIVREAATNTTVTDPENTTLYRVFNRSQRPEYRFELTLGPLTRVQAESLSAFHSFHQGGKSFFWDGETFGTVRNYQLFAEGTGAQRQFFLPNRNIGAGSLSFGTFRPSTGASSTWLASSANGWPWSLNAVPGTIAFANSSNTIPVSGDDLQAIYACQYRCVFEPDGLKMEFFDMGLWKASLKLRETAFTG